MMVSTKGRYALRVLIDLAEHQTDGYIPLKDTAARQEISEKYLEGIIKILVKAKLLEAADIASQKHRNSTQSAAFFASPKTPWLR